MFQLYRDRPIFVLCIICINIVLSLWCINADPIVNNDAVTYLSVAQKFVDGVWNQAFTHYNWPFYSIFIATVSKLFSIDVSHAAYALNTVFTTLLTLAFVCIAKELSNNNRNIIIIAALVILFFPSINKYRSFIIRDFGYLACYLWSLYFLVRFSSTLNKTSLLGWLLCTLMSILFRFEGIVFLLIVPYFLLIYATKKSPNKKTILILLSIVIPLIFISIVVWYLRSKYTGLINDANASGHTVNGLMDLFFVTVNTKLNGQSLTATNYLWMLFGNIGDVVYQLLRRMSIINFGLAFYAYKYRLVLKKFLFNRIWHIYVAINLVILVSFSFYNHFIVSRYTLATSLTLLILVPFAIKHMLTWAKESNKFAKYSAVFVVLLLTIESIDKLNIENKKYHIKDAGAWLSNHTVQGERIYSNNKLVIYYTCLLYTSDAADE